MSEKTAENIKASEIALQLTALVYQENKVSTHSSVITAYEACLKAVKKGIA